MVTETIFAGTVGEWDGVEVLQGSVGMTVKLDEDGWGWEQNLRARVRMGVTSVPVPQRFEKLL